MQLLRLPDGTIKALVEGKRRVEIDSFVPHDEYIQVEVRELFDDVVISSDILAYERNCENRLRSMPGSTKKLPKKW
jgi:ATP-dependent Lon protease